jgi:hypothetical protein
MEKFARESWTQSAFKKEGNLTLQIVACLFIFSQITVSLIGSI